MSEARSPVARAVAYAFVAIALALHGVIAWVSPLQGDDWTDWRWSRTYEHLAFPDRVLEFLSAHFTFSDLIGFVLARSTVVHAIVTPLVGLALVIGLFTIARRRLPRFDVWNDLVGLVVGSSLIWIATPRAATTWFHRPYVATWIYGAAAALWLLAPYRCRWQPRRAWVPLIFLGGFSAGSSTRQIGTILLVGVSAAIWRAPRPRARWMWFGLAGVVLGTLAVYLDTPQIDFRGFKAGFEGSLGAIGLSLREGGELISLVLGLAMVKLALVRLRPAWGGDEALPETHETMRWLWAWFGLTVLALLGPRYSEATLFPASLVLCIAALPYVSWFATSRPLRLVLCGLAIAIHVIVFSFALATYLPLGAEFRERVARLEQARAGSVAIIEPYSTVLPGFWSFGEDWAEVAIRQRIAIEVFDLRGVEFSSPFRSLDPDPGLDLRFEVTGVTPAELRAARAPAYWGTNLATARSQFEDLIPRLERVASGAFSARLVVVGFELDVLRGRPLLAATFEGGVLTTLKVTRKPPDDDNRQTVVTRPGNIVGKHRDAHLVIGKRSSPTISERGEFRVPAMTTELHSIVACDARRCLLVDAFVPRL